MLRNRLRYVLHHDRRLALWPVSGAFACGLREWDGDHAVLFDVPLTERTASIAMLDRNHPGDALCAMFQEIGEPVLFESMVRFSAELWGIDETPPHPSEMHLDVALQLIPYVDETGDAASREIAELHLRECARCAEDVADLRQMRRQRLQRRAAHASLAIAALVLAALFIWAAM